MAKIYKTMEEGWRMRKRYSVFKDMKRGWAQYACFAGNAHTHVGWNRLPRAAMKGQSRTDGNVLWAD